MAADDVLAEQMDYYRARAGEYDQWFLRQGRFDFGPEHRRAWFDDVGMVQAALDEAGPAGDVLELACGTGIWTERLAPAATRLTAVDASAEVIAINEARVADPRVAYVRADIFGWTPAARYDFIFFGFWLSHVPEEKFDGFWNTLSAALRPSGKVFFVDSLAMPAGARWRHSEMGAGAIVERRLNDGRTFRIVKVFHQPRTLAARLGALGWTGDVRATPHFFIHGTVSRAGSGSSGAG
jgi:demethylmenaquinone methyltransferase/2-methoxy-6-polyprenyl-1,4-benzoquinol methylase